MLSPPQRKGFSISGVGLYCGVISVEALFIYVCVPSAAGISPEWQFVVMLNMFLCGIRMRSLGC